MHHSNRLDKNTLVFRAYLFSWNACSRVNSLIKVLIKIKVTCLICCQICGTLLASASASAHWNAPGMENVVYLCFQIFNEMLKILLFYVLLYCLFYSAKEYCFISIVLWELNTFNKSVITFYHYLSCGLLCWLLISLTYQPHMWLTNKVYILKLSKLHLFYNKKTTFIFLYAKFFKFLFYTNNGFGRETNYITIGLKNIFQWRVACCCALMWYWVHQRLRLWSLYLPRYRVAVMQI